MNGNQVTNNNGANFSSNQTLNGNSAVAKKRTRYKYIAYDKTGKQVKGYFDAFRKMDVESFLVTNGYKIVEIKPVSVSKI